MVVSPDVGGVVRARALAKQLGCDLAIIDKRRPKANVSEVMHVIGEIEGRNCVIMDDMIDTAGTLVKAAEVLKERGAKKVYAYCTHAVFSGPAIERIRKARKLDEVVVTNTIPLGDEGKKCTQGPPAVGGLPVRRDDPPHLRRRVGHLACSPSRTTTSEQDSGRRFAQPLKGLRGVAAAFVEEPGRGPSSFGVDHEIRRF